MATNDSIRIDDQRSEGAAGGAFRRSWRAGAAVAGVATAAVVLLANPASAATPTGELCTTSQYTWYAEVTVGPDSPSAALGVEVPVAAPGETLRVESVLVNADASVSVGGITVTGAGEQTGGGEIAVHNSAETVTVTAVEVSVARCAEVAQLAEASAYAGAASGADLPATGSSTSLVALVGAVVLAIGAVLAGLGRRPADA